MAHTLMRSVETLGVHPVQLPHPFREVAVWRLNEQVVVISHLAVRMHLLVESQVNATQNVKPAPAVATVETDVLSTVSA